MSQHGRLQNRKWKRRDPSNRIEKSIGDVKEMFTNPLPGAINMLPGNPTDGQGKVIGDLGEIGNLYNKEEYILELTERVAILIDSG